MYSILESVFSKIFPTIEFMQDLWSAIPSTFRFVGVVFFGLGCLVSFIRFFL